MDYLGIEVLKEAGAYHLDRASQPLGVGDGSNKTFYTEYPITTLETVFYNEDNSYKNTPLTVSSQVGNRIIVNEIAPEGSKVFCHYYWQSITTAETDKAIAQAFAFVKRLLADSVSIEVDNLDDDLKLVIQLFAGGLLLGKQFNLAATRDDINNGEAKIKRAKMLLADIKKNILTDDAITTAVVNTEEPILRDL